jgi:quinol monooxygenase YgiN
VEANMLIVAGNGYVDPERRDALLASLDTPMRQARTEPGCLDFVVAADPVEPGRVNIYERWESREHLAAHLAATAQPAQPMPDVLSVDVMQYEISDFGPVRG